MNVLQIGNVTINWELFVSFASFLIAVLIISLRSRMEGQALRHYTDWALTVAVLFILNEKLGFLWDSPSIIWQQPRTLLYLNGTSANGTMLLLLGIAVWTTIYVHKRNLSYKVLLDLLAHGIFTWIAAYGWIYTLNGANAPGFTPLPLPSGFTAHGLPPAETLACLVLLAGMWVLRRPLGTLADAQLGFLAGGSLGMLGSYFKPYDSLWLGLGNEQWLYAVMLAAGYVAVRHREQMQRQDSARPVAHERAEPEPEADEPDLMKG
ncbi:prolipoprotein diacylglyceryl transferase [Paenibacillus apiarius]|uniref:Uncharacterized protein n=1 Tax=Paenibacillus apiarius TaxID=46240 RepID=A0ABT4DPJ9_9BACL|nr:hypothetical protein [Paenibacillus apiarius]MCY9515645.1 hypothetical protein [Paenibacillus apiarius]MCY9519282.1 hypothetical protein [Paenibacillus apiarius]MCY9550918.1 hypothetical protein [Paenibacillus apiarius]MCY9558990.1 hypothetical protein [Paenibacillus apiarius]MCY9683533.1 hypothetical protein [Paenibacillus apiarius]